MLERGKLSIDLIIRMGVFNLIPTILEVLFVCLLFGFYFGWQLVAIVLAMIVLYSWFSFYFSEKRIAIRREYIEADMEASTKAVDSLLNYETVKYFGNERWEADRYDRSMAKFEWATIKTYSSLAVLNAGQARDLHLGHGAFDAVRGARHRQRGHDDWRLRARERGFHPALPAA